MPLSADIPDDIWSHIAHFLPPKTLRNLYSLNRPLLDLALNERYREIRIVSRKQFRNGIKYLEHLRDPNISPRVRALVYNEGFSLSFPFPHNLTRDQILRLCQQLDALLVEVVSTFSNVTSFDISASLPPSDGLPAFISKAFDTFGVGLRVLTIHGPLGELSRLLPSSTDLKSLHTLSLSLNSSTSDAPSKNREHMTGIVAPFLCEISPTLRTLSITSSVAADHSVLFEPMDRPSTLASLSLDMSFGRPSFENPSGLVHFMNTNSTTLKHVILKDSRDCTLLTGKSSVQLCLPNLETLEAETEGFLRFLGQPGLYLQSSKDTLTTLILGQYYMSLQELTELATTLSHRATDRGLRSLYVCVDKLSPQVFDVLSETLIRLDDLTVVYSYKGITAKADNEDSMPHDFLVPDDEEEVTDAFIDEMAKRTYIEWRLRSLSILDDPDEPGLGPEHMIILSALKRSIPSVVTDRESEYAERGEAKFDRQLQEYFGSVITQSFGRLNSLQHN